MDKENFKYCYYIPEKAEVLDFADKNGITSIYKRTSEEVKKLHPTAEFITWDEAYEQIQRFNREEYLDKPPSEISEERYFHMFGVLFPGDWQTSEQGESFYVTEAFTNNIYYYYVNLTAEDKFFELMAYKGAKHSDLIERCRSYLAQQDPK